MRERKYILMFVISSQRFFIIQSITQIYICGALFVLLVLFLISQTSKKDPDEQDLRAYLICEINFPSMLLTGFIE